METVWAVMVQKQDQHGGYSVPVILGQKVYADKEEAEAVCQGVPRTGGHARSHAYIIPLDVH